MKEVQASPRRNQAPLTVASLVKPPSSRVFVIWLIVTSAFLIGAIVLAVLSCVWWPGRRDYDPRISAYEKQIEEIKGEIEQPCDEFEQFITACKSEEIEHPSDLQPYWNNYLNNLASRDSDGYRVFESLSYSLSSWSEIESLAIGTDFFKHASDSFGNSIGYVVNSECADEFESALLEKINDNLMEILARAEEQLNANNEWRDYCKEVATAFFVPCVITFVFGIAGVFITRKKRIAYKNAAREYADAEESKHMQIFSMLEEMQRKIDALEGRTSTEAAFENTVQTRYQELFLPTSVQHLSPSMAGSYKQTDIDQSLLARPKSKMEKLLKTLDERQENAEGVGKIFLAVIFFPLRLVLKTLTLRTMRAAFIEADKISKETAARHEVGGYAEAKHRKAQEEYRRLNTNEEKMLFFYRHFAAVKSCSKPTTYAYIMTYLAEHSQLFDKNDPLKLASCFTDNVDHALCSLIGLDPKTFPDDRQYEQLLRRSDKELASDKYVLQCLLIAANGKEDGTVPFYRYGILDRENASQQTAQEF